MGSSARRTRGAKGSTLHQNPSEERDFASPPKTRDIPTSDNKMTKPPLEHLIKDLKKTVGSGRLWHSNVADDAKTAESLPPISLCEIFSVKWLDTPNAVRLTDKQVLSFCMSNGVAPLLALFDGHCVKEAGFAEGMQQQFIRPYGLDPSCLRKRAARVAHLAAKSVTDRREDESCKSLVVCAGWSSLLYNKNRNGFFKNSGMTEHDGLQFCASILLLVYVDILGRARGCKSFFVELIKSPLGKPMQAEVRKQWESLFLLSTSKKNYTFEQHSMDMEDGSVAIDTNEKLADCGLSVEQLTGLENILCGDAPKESYSPRTTQEAPVFTKREVLAVAQVIRQQHNKLRSQNSTVEDRFKAIAAVLPLRPLREVVHYISHNSQSLLACSSSQNDSRHSPPMISGQEYLATNSLCVNLPGKPVEEKTTALYEYIKEQPTRMQDYARKPKKMEQVIAQVLQKHQSRFGERLTRTVVESIDKEPVDEVNRFQQLKAESNEIMKTFSGVRRGAQSDKEWYKACLVRYIEEKVGGDVPGQYGMSCDMYIMYLRRLIQDKTGTRMPWVRPRWSM